MEASNGKHILIIDDDQATREVFGTKLNSQGFEVLYAKDGNEGCEIAREQPVDLILLDLRMPEPHGLETARRLRAEATHDFKLVFLTNMDVSAEVEQEIKGTYADEFFHKSLDFDYIVAKITELLGE